MASNLKNRINRISKKANPKCFQTTEDINFRVHRSNNKELTDEERRRIEETKNLPLHPDLEKVFKRLEDRHRQREDTADGPR